MNMLQKIMSKTESPVVFISVFPFWITGVAMEYFAEELAIKFLARSSKTYHGEKLTDRVLERIRT